MALLAFVLPSSTFSFPFSTASLAFVFPVSTASLVLSFASSSALLPFSFASSTLEEVAVEFSVFFSLLPPHADNENTATPTAIINTIFYNFHRPPCINFLWNKLIIKQMHKKI